MTVDNLHIRKAKVFKSSTHLLVPFSEIPATRHDEITKSDNIDYEHNFFFDLKDVYFSDTHACIPGKAVKEVFENCLKCEKRQSPAYDKDINFVELCCSILKQCGSGEFNPQVKPPDNKNIPDDIFKSLFKNDKKSDN